MAEERRYCPLCEGWVEGKTCPVHNVPTIAESSLKGAERGLPEGTVIAGRYTIQRLLGEGGMGTVYLAAQSSINRKIALKTLSLRLRNDPRLLKRFYREARASSALIHPNIVQVYDFGIDESTTVPFIAMEYLQGAPLDELVEKEKSLPEARAAYYVGEVARALTEAHDKGVVHRDLKPDNVMVRQLADGTEQIKVLDFGIAKIARGDSDSYESLTAAGVAVGTPSFMSPEQAMGSQLDYRSDLYSLGCLLHQLLTGRPPFEAPEMVGILMKHVKEPAPVLPERLADGLAPTMGLRSIYQRLMAKSPNDRPQSTREVAEIFGRLAGREVSGRAAALSSAPSLPGITNGGRSATPMESEVTVSATTVERQDGHRSSPNTPNQPLDIDGSLNASSNAANLTADAHPTPHPHSATNEIESNVIAGSFNTKVVFSIITLTLLAAGLLFFIFDKNQPAQENQAPAKIAALDSSAKSDDTSQLADKVNVSPKRPMSGGDETSQSTQVRVLPPEGQLVKAPTAAPGRAAVRITSTPTGARIFRDNKILGETPMEELFQAVDFPVQLTVRKRGYESGRLTIETGQDAVNITLAKRRGSTTKRSNRRIKRTTSTNSNKKKPVDQTKKSGSHLEAW